MTTQAEAVRASSETRRDPLVDLVFSAYVNLFQM